MRSAGFPSSCGLLLGLERARPAERRRARSGHLRPSARPVHCPFLLGASRVFRFMIERIWIRNFRMLASNRLDLMPFAVLVGRNATGKSTLMSAIRFISNVLSQGVEAAVDLAIDTWERPEDKHLVLEATFAGAHEAPVPSWLLSDGTLRLMALSLLSFSEREDGAGVYLIEEPENGLHPQAIQSVYSALSTMTSMQVFVAAHSPVFLANTSLEDAPVFSRSDSGMAHVMRGPEVAEIKQWQERVFLADVFATGVL